MHTLHALDGAIYARNVKIATIRPERAAAVLMQDGMRREVAVAVAFGALAGLEGTKQLAARVKLISK